MLFRKAILLIHGFAGGSYDYRELANDLELVHNFDVYSFTLLGHEKTFITDVTSEDWTRKAEDEIEKLTNNGYHSIYVIGHSMGGVIAGHLARKYKRHVKKFVLAAPAFRYFEFKDYDREEVLSRILTVPVPTIRQFINLAEKHQEDIKFIECPTLILRREDNDIVPMGATKYVYDNIKSNSVSMFTLEVFN